MWLCRNCRAELPASGQCTECGQTAVIPEDELVRAETVAAILAGVERLETELAFAFARTCLNVN